ncbi:hypothetical protein MHH28_27370 [Paenibacillus sp. FSL K6-1217]|uniref:hypothetical protein n=1 Tax=Paenibacillus sp. FSL K6-1217 TaxID=2921466 RepID=UPI00324BCB77
MDWLHAYEDELRVVFEESRRVISAFPEPLNARGLSYLNQFNVFHPDSHKNYICYLLPFWLQDSCSLSPELARRMSAGNIFLMLYFFLQDDLMDSPEASAAQTLPLANLLYVEFLATCLPLFPADSPFWPCFSRYIREWADSVNGEAGSDYFLNDRIRISHKASPLKLSSTAALLLSGQSSSIPEAEEMIHTVLLTLQLLDDYEDWEQDLEDGSYNCLLSLARSSTGIAAGEPLTEAAVKNFIYVSGGLADYAATAQANHLKLLEAALELPLLVSFHLVLVQNLQQIAETIEAQKQILLGGGLDYWLSTQPNLS